MSNKQWCDPAFPFSWDFPHKEECKQSSECFSKDDSQETRLPCECTEGAPSPSICESHRRAVTLGLKSYSSFALSFVPDPQSVSIRLKFKTKSEDGLLVLLSSRKDLLSLSLHVSVFKITLNFIHFKKFSLNKKFKKL